jgi:pseudouridine-5'-phosphate glycosidase
MQPPLLQVCPEVLTALAQGRPVVALESTVIAHGLPRPLNLEVARALEQTVRDAGAVPATVAVCAGRPTVGVDDAGLQLLAGDAGVLKASRRDLCVAVAQGKTAATTVAATMFLAHHAGVRVLATGGIGGAHRDPDQPWDISADLIELSRTPVAVICAGAKSVLDMPRTLEILETHGVPVIGYGTDEFPAFYLHSSGEPASARVDTPAQAAALLQAHWALGGAGVVLAQPMVAELALDADELAGALTRVEGRAADQGVRGKELTPFLLAQLAEATEGKTLEANRALLLANARLAADVARCLGARD